MTGYACEPSVGLRIGNMLLSHAAYQAASFSLLLPPSSPSLLLPFAAGKHPVSKNLIKNYKKIIVYITCLIFMVHRNTKIQYNSVSSKSCKIRLMHTESYSDDLHSCQT
jgi:hypothetical protein